MADTLAFYLPALFAGVTVGLLHRWLSVFARSWFAYGGGENIGDHEP